MAVFHELQSEGRLSRLMSYLNNKLVPFENFLLSMDGHFAKNDVKLLVQRYTIIVNFFECLKDFLLLTKESSLFEVAKQDCQEKIKHDYVAREYKQDKVYGAKVVFGTSHTLVHNLVPALAE